MDLKDHIETEYSDRYMNAAYMVKVLRRGGLAFVDWAIEPEKMNFAADGNSVRAYFELVLRIEDKSGAAVFERTEEIPLSITPDQYRSHEKQRFSFQDMLPVVPGEYKMIFLLKNKTGKDFSSWDAAVSVPGGNGPYLGAPVLFLAAEDAAGTEAGRAKAFRLGGRQYVVGARNEFLQGSNLGVLVQGWNMDGSGSGSFEVELVSLDTGRSAGSWPLAVSPAGGNDPGTVNAEAVIPLSSLSPGYYRAEASLKDAAGKKTMGRSENFIILSAPIPVVPWVYARRHPAAPSTEDLKVLAGQYFLARDLDKAAAALRDVLSRADDPASRLLLAKVLYGQGRFRESVEAAGPVYGKTGDRETAKVLALGHFGLREWEKALTFLDRILTEANEVPVINLAAECHVNLGHYDQALALLRKSLEMVPDQPATRELEEKIIRISGKSEKES